MKLFDRGTRHVGLTDAGRALLPLAQRILADLDAIERTIRETVQLESGLVQLGAQQSVTACGALPTLLVAYRALHPGIDVVMQEESVEEALTLLKDRKLDMVLAQFEPHHESDSLVSETLYHEDMALVVGPGSPLLKSVRSLRDLTTENFLAFNKSAALRRMLVQLCADVGFQPQIGYESPSLGSIRAMASAGLGVALLPVPSILAAGPPVCSLAVPSLPSRPISLVRGRDRYQSFASHSLAQHLQQSLEAQVNALIGQATGS